MKCQIAEKWLLLQDAGELPAGRKKVLIDHVESCTSCMDFQRVLTESRPLFPVSEEPSPKAVQNVLRAARMHAPEKKTAWMFGWKPAAALAAAVVIGIGIVFSAFSPDRVGLELVFMETQLLETEDQLANVMYEGLSEDDLAFNFLMTYEGNGQG